MKLLPDQGQVYLAIGNTDMRKSINGLSILVADDFNLDPFSGNLFAFCNRGRKIIKILFWDNNGFCLWHKRLEKVRFCWPQSESDIINLDTKQMAWLLAGLDIEKAHKQQVYSEV